MTEEQLLEEVRRALNRRMERPPREEGWLTMNELRDIMTPKGGVRPSETWIRRRLRDAPGEWEKQEVNNLAYYRHLKKNGNSGQVDGK